MCTFVHIYSGDRQSLPFFHRPLPAPYPHVNKDHSSSFCIPPVPGPSLPSVQALAFKRSPLPESNVHGHSASIPQMYWPNYFDYNLKRTSAPVWKFCKVNPPLIPDRAIRKSVRIKKNIKGQISQKLRKKVKISESSFGELSMPRKIIK